MPSVKFNDAAYGFNASIPFNGMDVPFPTRVQFVFQESIPDQIFPSSKFLNWQTPIAPHGVLLVWSGLTLETLDWNGLTNTNLAWSGITQ